MATGDRLQIADKPTLDEILKRVGETSDSNTIFTELDKIFNIVAKNSSSLIASDTELKKMVSNEITNNLNSDVVIGTFTPHYSGSIRIKCALMATGRLDGKNGKVQIYNAHQLLVEIPPTKLDSYHAEQADISVIKDITYTVKLSTGYMIALLKCNYLAICGTVMLPDTSIID